MRCVAGCCQPARVAAGRVAPRRFDRQILSIPLDPHQGAWWGALIMSELEIAIPTWVIALRLVPKNTRSPGGIGWPGGTRGPALYCVVLRLHHPRYLKPCRPGQARAVEPASDLGWPFGSSVNSAPLPPQTYRRPPCGERWTNTGTCWTSWSPPGGTSGPRSGSFVSCSRGWNTCPGCWSLTNSAATALPGTGCCARSSTVSRSI
jgi:hypothetical protein